ncbi:MAG: membrane protein insertase YidC [Clostridiales bacterium]|nr:membrane protein insertase YidC [Clostridiales bacterium]
MKNLIVAPFAKIIGFIFLSMLSIFKSPGLTLIFLSIAVNIILLPFYYLAERIEKKERDIQDKMKPKIDEFKSVYKGYELHLYVKNVYRLHGYKPIYSLRGLISLLIQLPFFMGAYYYLSSYSGFQGVGFLFFNDLSKADALLSFAGLQINILPFLMTFLNLASGFVYSKGKEAKDKITIVVIALLFLIILYKSPSSLLIYWTFNNLFSLIKNLVLIKLEAKKKKEGEPVHAG